MSGTPPPPFTWRLHEEERSLQGALRGRLGLHCRFGLDRGQGTERFNTGATPVGAGIKFDSVVIFRLDGSTTVNRFTDTATVLSRPLSFSGNTVSGTIDGSLLPSTLAGVDKSSFTWNLWPRDSGPAGTPVVGNAQISDFAPDASNAVVAVPEPETYALLSLGLGCLAWVSRRRARAAGSVAAS